MNLLLILFHEVYEICTILTNGCLDFSFTAEKFKITFPEVLRYYSIHSSFTTCRLDRDCSN